MVKNSKGKQILLISKIVWTITSLLLFLVWLMFMTKNFYPKTTTSLVAQIMNISIQIMIWPFTIIILFIYIMPVWVTNKKVILVLFLITAFIVTLFSTFFLFALYINNFWILWLITHILVFIAFFFHIMVLSKQE